MGSSNMRRVRPPHPSRRRHRPLAWALATLLLITAGACSDSGSEEAGSTSTTEAPMLGSIELDTVPVEGCDDLQARHCYLPFPSDAYTTEAATDTGRQVAFSLDHLPRNSEGTPIDPAEWNRNDGFSPGTPIMVWVPQADLERSGVGLITDLEHSVSDESAILIVDAETGERIPHWAELDANASSDLTQLLIVRPARNLDAGQRYVVAIRNLVDRGGETIRPSDVFLAYRDRLETGNRTIEQRRDHMESIFTTLADQGVARGELWLAWDFTVASRDNLTGRMVHIRDDAFAALGDDAPAFEITEVEEPEGDDAEHVAFWLHGTFEVPLYLTGAGEPGSRFTQGSDGLPRRNAETESYTASFQCTVPRSLVEDGADPGGGVVYGHGLLGSRDEVGARNIRLMTDEHGLIYCATDWIGMSEDDFNNVLEILLDLSRFPTLADRVQQGMLNTLFLGRLLSHPDGLAAAAELQRDDGTPMLDPDRLAYDGNSQGGIIGGAVAALATDWERSALGVPGMNYSTLLDRSSDFSQFNDVLERTYPDELDQVLSIALIQMLWDRAEANGYAQFMTTDPLPGTPEHRVLLHVAFGDFQVADVAAFVEARTIGAAYHDPVLAEGRAFIDYTYGLEPIESYPHDGSAVVLWDSGVPSPPLTNTPPTGQGDPDGAHDPHEDPRMMAAAREQKAQFFLDGTVIDVCDGAPCLADRVD